MDCNKANEYMMKIIDNIATDYEIQALEKHISTCKYCNESYTLYKNMIEKFSDIDIYNVPENFENKVMYRVKKLSHINLRFKHLLEKVLIFTLIVWFTTLLFKFIRIINLILRSNTLKRLIYKEL